MDHEQQAREMINRNGAMIVGEGWCVSGAKLASLQSELAALLAREWRMREALEAVLTEAADNMIALDCRRAIEAALAPIAAEPAQPAAPSNEELRIKQAFNEGREFEAGMRAAQLAPVAQPVAREEPAASLWETIKILGLSNDRLARQAIAAALTSARTAARREMRHEAAMAAWWLKYIGDHDDDGVVHWLSEVEAAIRALPDAQG